MPTINNTNLLQDRVEEVQRYIHRSRRRGVLLALLVLSALVFGVLYYTYCIFGARFEALSFLRTAVPCHAKTTVGMYKGAGESHMGSVKAAAEAVTPKGVAAMLKNDPMFRNSVRGAQGPQGLQGIPGVAAATQRASVGADTTNNVTPQIAYDDNSVEVVEDELRCVKDDHILQWVEGDNQWDCVRPTEAVFGHFDDKTVNVTKEGYMVCEDANTILVYDKDNEDEWSCVSAGALTSGAGALAAGAGAVVDPATGALACANDEDIMQYNAASGAFDCIDGTALTALSEGASATMTPGEGASVADDGSLVCENDEDLLQFNVTDGVWNCVDGTILSALNEQTTATLAPGAGASVNDDGSLACIDDNDVLQYDLATGAWDCVAPGALLASSGNGAIAPGAGATVDPATGALACANDEDIMQYNATSGAFDCVAGTIASLSCADEEIAVFDAVADAWMCDTVASLETVTHTTLSPAGTLTYTDEEGTENEINLASIEPWYGTDDNAGATENTENIYTKGTVNIRSTIDAGTDGTSALIIGDPTGQHVQYDNNEIFSYNPNGSNSLHINYDSGNNTTLNGSTGNVGIGTTTPRVKTEIKTTLADPSALTANTSHGGFLLSDGGNVGMVMGLTSGYDSYIQARNNAGANNRAYDLLLNPLGGNVGIGTTSPTKSLDVNGEARVRTLTAGATTDEIVVADSTGVLKKVSGATMAAANEPWYGTDDNAGATENTENIYTMGNVAVGSDTGDGALNVVGNSIVSRRTENDTSVRTNHTFKRGAGNGDNFQIRTIGDGTDGVDKLLFWSSEAGNILSLVDAVGNVGIGTTSPASRLDIHASSIGDTSLRIGGRGTSSNSELLFSGFEPTNIPASLATLGTKYGAIETYPSNSNKVNQFRDNTPTDGEYWLNAAGEVALTLLAPSKSLGIGTISPTKSLDVDGEARVRTLTAGATTDEIVVADSTGVLKKVSASSVGTAAAVANEPWYGTDDNAGATENTENIYTMGGVGIGIQNTGGGLHIANGDLNLSGSDTRMIRFRNAADNDHASLGIYNGGLALSGTSSPHPDKQHVFINNIGNVGIGTTSPTAKTQISTWATNTGLQIDKITGNYGGAQIYLNENRLSSSAHQKAIQMGNTTTPQVEMGAFYSSTTDELLRFYIDTDPTDVGIEAYSTADFAIDAAGRVAIGSTEPTNQLDVFGDVRVRTLTAGATTDEIVVADSTGVLKKVSGATMAAANEPWYGTDDNAGATENTENIYTMGRVGIGTDSPMRDFHVSSTSGIRLSDNNATSIDEVNTRIEYYHGDNTQRAGYTGFLSTTNGHYYIANETTTGDIRFRTNSLDRGVIDDAGNFGIGTTSPASRLDIHASSIGDTSLRIGGRGTSSNSELLFSGFEPTNIPASLATLGTQYGAIETYPLNSNKVNQFRDNSPTDGEYWLNAAGEVALTLLAPSKSLGIGTISPTKSLDVDGEARVRTLTAGAATDEIVVADSTGVLKKVSSATMAAANEPWYGTDDNAGATENTENIYTMGRVGIGTDSPTEKFEVYGGAMSINNTGAGDQILRFKEDGNNKWALYRDDSIGGGFRLHNYDNNVTPFFAKATGNVGIGTTNPLHRLTVFGEGGGASAVNQGLYMDRAAIDFNGIDGSDKSSIYGYKHGLALSRNAYVGAVAAGGSLEPDLFIDRDGDVGIGTVGPSERLDVAGNVRATGYITASDKRYKDDVEGIDSALEAITKLDGKIYDYKDEYREEGFDDHKQFGFIAQEIEEVFPHLVYEDNEGYKSVNYQGVIPVLAEAVKELNEKVDSIDTPSENTITDIVNNILDGLFEIRDKAIAFTKDIIFEDNVTFLDKVTFLDRVTYADEDRAGFAEIKDGEREVSVQFQNAYSVAPFVTVTPSNTYQAYRLKEVTGTGFTIRLEKEADKDIAFTWTAVQVTSVDGALASDDDVASAVEEATTTQETTPEETVEEVVEETATGPVATEETVEASTETSSEETAVEATDVATEEAPTTEETETVSAESEAVIDENNPQLP